MILTCPACDTKYVVKDDAIPPGGRQVRCASCKHSWHQEPEGVVVEAESVAVNFAGPPEPSSEMFDEPTADAPPRAIAEDYIADEPEPEGSPLPDWQAPAAEPVVEPSPADEVAMEEAPAVADEWRRPEPGGFAPVEEPAVAAESSAVLDEPIAAATASPATVEEEFVGYAPIAEEDEARHRRWPLILGILVLIVAAAAAFWFLAPAEWRAKAGIAQAGATPLQLMITTKERQRLNSRNELVVLGGRIINPTDREQAVPPIQAQLRDPQSKAVLHRWTIDPPARVIAPLSSASFNSAELDEPRDGSQLLEVTLGG